MVGGGEVLDDERRGRRGGRLAREIRVGRCVCVCVCDSVSARARACM